MGGKKHEKVSKEVASVTAAVGKGRESSPVVELRVYLRLESLAQQFAAYMATPTRARGYPPKAGDHSLIVEVAPALAIQQVLDVALKSSPDVEPGLLYVERQYGILELHSPRLEDVEKAGQAILKSIRASEHDRLKPTVLYSDVIESITDQHAILLNRTREASMIMPGASLLVYEVAPALFAAFAADWAEKVSPNITLVDVQMIGATGRLFVAGAIADVQHARGEIDHVWETMKGRQSRAVG